MARVRPPKKPRVEVAACGETGVEQANDSSDSGNDGAGADVEAGDEDQAESNELLPRRAPVKSSVGMEERNDRENEAAPLPEDQDILDNLPFCCAVCHCSSYTKARVEHDRFIEPAEGYLWHRKCCHGVFVSDQTWVPPITAAMQKAGTAAPQKDVLEWITARQVKQAYKIACSQEAALYNDDSQAHDVDVLRTSEDYMTGIQEAFQERVESAKQDSSKLCSRATVLDVFAGVGTGIVVLKRLGIDIGKVIHVEHDKIATHVYRSNHDRSYCPELPDDGGIEHVCVSTFEELVKNVEVFLAKHGPIDIVLGGPPCVDYSAVNAYRKGATGAQGQYMIQFGEMIRKLERLQSPHPLFFLAENVFLKGEDLETARNAYGFDWDPVGFDALYVSPTRRKRHFFTNVPLLLEGFDFQGSASHSVPTSCLEKGFQVPAHWVDGDITAKAQCLMASASRINERNSLRMYVFHDQSETTGKYHGRPMNVLEREKLMGYPDGYVEKPVEVLFETLVDKGLEKLYDAPSHCWKTKLPRKYHHFAGNYHCLPRKDAYRFEVKGSCCVAMMMAPRLAIGSEKSEPTFFDADNYAKHLIGLAYSVPVVELLLKPLKGIFRLRHYDGYDYRYKWEEGEVKSATAAEVVTERVDGQAQAPSCP